MNKLKSYATIAAIALVLMMSISMFTAMASDTATTPESTVTPAAVNLMQYEWPHGGDTVAMDRFSAGPGPNSPDLVYKTAYSGIGSEVTTWKGKAFARGNNNNIVCFDALTGKQLWQSPGGAQPMYGFMPSVQVVDDNYVITWHYYGFYIVRQTDGALVANMTGLNVVQNVGSGRYWPYRYDMSTKTLYTSYQSDTGYSQQIRAYDLSNPTNPTLKWATDRPRASEMLAVGGGKVYMGCYEWAIYALDAATGKIVWFKAIEDALGYTGCFIPGTPNTLIAGCVSGRLYKFNADTGDTIWTYTYGYAGFAAQGGGIGYGMYYEQYFNLDGLHYAAWNVTTGKIVWDRLAGRNEVSVPYINPAIADGKVWIQVQRQDPKTLRDATSTVCFNAYTGETLYEIPVALGTPSVAYGNLYGGASGYLWCFGASKDWAMFRGSPDNPGIAVGQAGPTNLVYKWTFKTGGPVTSSAAVVSGKVYIGSMDQNLYCLDAYTGAKIWSFATAYRVLASPAVVGGKVYTGIEDGSLDCLDANTGAVIWTKTGFATSDLAYGPAAFSIRSSPIVSNGKLYIGSTADYKIYCIDTANGNILWNYTTGGPVGSSAVVLNGVVYQASADNQLYALNAATGQLLWKSLIPYDNDQPRATVPPFDPSWARSVGLQMFEVCSVAVAPDLNMVYIHGNRDYRNDTQNVGNFFAYNMTNGNLVWKKIVPGGNFGPASPTYLNGVLYHSFGQYSYAMNATNGAQLWAFWTTFQGFSSPTVADSVTGPLMYYGNGFYTLQVINATGTRVAWQTVGSQIVSSPALWENKVYVGSADYVVYCFQGTVPNLG